MRTVLVALLCLTACAGTRSVGTARSEPAIASAVDTVRAVPFDPRRMTHPTMISGSSPSYTLEALRHRIEGVIHLKCRITVEGRVVGCRVLKSLPYLDEAVVSALERRRYRPALLDGKPVEIDYTFKIAMRIGI